MANNKQEFKDSNNLNQNSQQARNTDKQEGSESEDEMSLDKILEEHYKSLEKGDRKLQQKIEKQFIEAYIQVYTAAFMNQYKTPEQKREFSDQLVKQAEKVLEGQKIMFETYKKQKDLQ